VKTEFHKYACLIVRPIAVGHQRYKKLDDFALAVENPILFRINSEALQVAISIIRSRVIDIGSGVCPNAIGLSVGTHGDPDLSRVEVRVLKLFQAPSHFGGAPPHAPGESSNGVVSNESIDLEKFVICKAEIGLSTGTRTSDADLVQHQRVSE